MIGLIMKLVLAVILIVGGVYGTILFGMIWFKEIPEFRDKAKVPKSEVLDSKFGILVKIIESQLASENATITHSAQIKDSSCGTYRTVPILVEDSIGPHRIKIAIEIFDQNTKVDVDEVDIMMGKYFSLGIPRAILVSKVGFTEEAYKKANTLPFIHLLTFDEAKDEDWIRVMDTMKQLELQLLVLPHLTGANLWLHEGETLPKETMQVSSTSIQTPSGELISADEWIKKILWNKNIVKSIQDKITEPGSYTSAVRVPMRGFYIIGLKGDKRALHSIELIANFRTDKISVPLDRMSYGEAQVAIGEINKIGHEFTFVITEEKDDGAIIGVRTTKLTEDNKK